MSGHSQDLEAFRALADTWGGDLERWPQERRAWAEAMAADERAAAILQEARRLDARIEAGPVVPDSRAAAIAGAVMGRIAQERLNAPRAWWAPIAEALFTPSGAPGLAAYACVALGVVAGAMMGAAAPIGIGAEEEIASLLFVSQQTSPFEGIIQ